jgi:hypothetical protein
VAIAGAILSIALPFTAYASEAGPVPAHPITRSDTLAKVEKPKSERPAPSATKTKLKPSKATPSGQLRPEFVPDQPWETEFYVENDIVGRQAMQVAFASTTHRSVW